MPLRLCAEPGCPEPAHYRGRCRIHARTTNRLTHRNRDVYNSKRWRLLRRKVLFNQPLCACGCGHIATDVDHVTPIEQGGLPYSLSNLQALTHECHARKTRQEQQAVPTPQQGAS